MGHVQADPFANLRKSVSGLTKSEQIPMMMNPFNSAMGLRQQVQKQDFEFKKGKHVHEAAQETEKPVQRNAHVPRKVNITLNDLNCEVAEEGASPEIEAVKKRVVPRIHITSNIKVIQTEPTSSPFKNHASMQGEYFPQGIS